MLLCGPIPRFQRGSAQLGKCFRPRRRTTRINLKDMMPAVAPKSDGNPSNTETAPNLAAKNGRQIEALGLLLRHGPTAPADRHQKQNLSALQLRGYASGPNRIHNLFVNAQYLHRQYQSVVT